MNVNLLSPAKYNIIHDMGKPNFSLINETKSKNDFVDILNNLTAEKTNLDMEYSETLEKYKNDGEFQIPKEKVDSEKIQNRELERIKDAREGLKEVEKNFGEKYGQTSTHGEKTQLNNKLSEKEKTRLESKKDLDDVKKSQRIKSEPKISISQNIDYIITLLGNEISKLISLRDLPSNVKDQIYVLKQKLDKIPKSEFTYVDLLNLIAEFSRVLDKVKSINGSLLTEINENLRTIFELSKLIGSETLEMEVKNQDLESRALLDNKLNSNFDAFDHYVQTKSQSDRSQETRQPEFQNIFRVIFDKPFNTNDLQQKYTQLTPQNTFLMNLQNIKQSLHELSGRIVINLKQNINEMKMSLYPPELGKIFIKFSGDQNSITGSIVLSTKEALTLFQEHIQDLKSNLQNQGINISSLSVEIDTTLNQSFENDKKFGVEEVKVTRASFRKSAESYEKANVYYGDYYHDGNVNIYA